jgi:hypothetical protein
MFPKCIVIFIIKLIYPLKFNRFGIYLYISQIYTNTATKDELMTITDRGEKRSGMIIKDSSKAALNL